MYQLKASETDLEIIETVINDVKKSVTCELGLAGSLTQRALLPDLPLWDKKPLEKSDIDLLLIDTGDNCPVLPTIKNDFRIIEVSKFGGKYYFGLRHKKTDKWVDLFPLLYPRGFAEVKLGSFVYKGDTVASQILYLADDILSRGGRHLAVRKQWIDKLNLLWHSDAFDKAKIEEEYQAHFSKGATIREFVEKALAVKPTSKLKDLYLTSTYLRNNRTTTPNGISATIE